VIVEPQNHHVVLDDRAMESRIARRVIVTIATYASVIMPSTTVPVSTNGPYNFVAEWSPCAPIPQDTRWTKWREFYLTYRYLFLGIVLMANAAIWALFARDWKDIDDKNSLRGSLIVLSVIGGFVGCVFLMVWTLAKSDWDETCWPSPFPPELGHGPIYALGTPVEEPGDHPL
jgi:hypothetical protein